MFDRPHVVHMTTAHVASDNRIFEKECRTLAAEGYQVSLVVPTTDTGESHGVIIEAVAPPTSRAERFLLTSGRVFARALTQKADLYHFHDPDLVPWGVLLRILTGKPVIYDIHEDYPSGIAMVPYLPKLLGRVAARTFALLEWLAARALFLIIAERYYARRFPAATPVLNYPRLDAFDELPRTPAKDPDEPPRLLYTGNLSDDRGAMTMARLLAREKNVQLVCIGRVPSRVAAEMLELADGPERLQLVGVDAPVPFARILDAYRERWTCALALFEDNAHSREKEITKLFEYMAAGIPIVCSHFPVWRRLVEDTGSGLCVPPDDLDALARAVASIHDDPERARRMSRAGHAAAREHYSWRSQGQNLLRLYARLLPTERTRPTAAVT